MTVWRVHTVPGSPYGRAVMAMLEEKQADWRLMALAPGDHQGQAYLALQPFGRMPALEWAGGVLYETQAILRYLDEVLPGPSLMPGDAEGRARVNQAMGICDAYLFPESARVIVFQRVVGPALMGLVPDEAAIAAAMPRSHTIFAELSRLLGDRAWFGGGSVSIADLMLGSHIEFYRRTPEWAELTEGRANVVAWLERVEARPAMAAVVWEALPALIARQAALGGAIA